MSKRTFIIFGLLVAFLAVLIPWLAFRSNGDAAAGAEKVAANLETGQSLFQTNCGTCHTLHAAGTDGNFAPNLDELLAPNGPPEAASPEEEEAAKKDIAGIKSRVLNAIEHGFDSPTTPGRMPPGILSGEQAQEVANFVAHTAGEG